MNAAKFGVIVGTAGLMALGVTACGGGSAPTATAGTPAAASSATSAGTPASSAPATAAPSAAGGTGTCASAVTSWYQLTTGGKAEIAEFHAIWTNINAPGIALATRLEEGKGLAGTAMQDAKSPATMPACGDPAHAWETAMTDFQEAGELTVKYPDGATVVPAATQDANAGFAALVTVAGEINKYTPAQP